MKKLRGFLSRNKRAFAGAGAVMAVLMLAPVAAHAGSGIVTGSKEIADEIQKWGKYAGIIGLVVGVAMTYMADSEGPGRKIGYAMLFLGLIGSVSWIVGRFGLVG